MPRSRSDILDDWAPPALRRAARRARARRGASDPASASTPAAGPVAAPAPRSVSSPAAAPGAGVEPRWSELTERSLAGLSTCAEIYRPTNFWGPGVGRLLSDMERLGLENFKAWPEAFFWFYPTYGARLTWPAAARLSRALRARRPDLDDRWLQRALRAVPEATRDHDAALLAWDQERWPCDLLGFGEAEVGNPRQRYSLGGRDDVMVSKPYLNYLMCLAALSRHVDRAPQSFLELGGGFGALGEVVLARDPEARYVNLDIPPLLTVSSYYLTTVFGDERVQVFDANLPAEGPIAPARSACLPNWRIADLQGPFDVFVNSFSFQEMEPDVVEHYIERVADLGVEYVVSLNSRYGKAKATGDGEVGVREQVTSASIGARFEQRGYEVCASYTAPLIRSAGELLVLRLRR